MVITLEDQLRPFNYCSWCGAYIPSELQVWSLHSLLIGLNISIALRSPFQTSCPPKHYSYFQVVFRWFFFFSSSSLGSEVVFPEPQNSSSWTKWGTSKDLHSSLPKSSWELLNLSPPPHPLYWFHVLSPLDLLFSTSKDGHLSDSLTQPHQYSIAQFSCLGLCLGVT